MWGGCKGRYDKRYYSFKKKIFIITIYVSFIMWRPHKIIKMYVVVKILNDKIGNKIPIDTIKYHVKDIYVKVTSQ